MGLRIFIPLFIPLMIIKVISHLSDCFRARSLIFYRNPSKSSICIKFHIIGIQNILVCISYPHIFISLYSLIILTRNSCLLSRNLLFQLLDHPIFLSLFWFVNSLFLIAFLFRGALRWRGWRWFSSNFYVVGWEETFQLWSFNCISIPPSIFKRLLHKYFITFLEGNVCWVIISLFFISFLLFLLFL